ncbi:MAG: M23 family metallopeptidase [Oscillospiraceae bacterium]|jgi:murein DD-endopeptidase MepM/ murein hydrolase activator NlpD|nr:M23 family metallopeptidase [Oscillospiraceae bacterium]
MQFENKTKFRRPRLPKGGGFYLALSLAVVAVGVGVWGAVSNTLRSNPYTLLTTERSTINWENYVTRPPEPETQQANDPVTNVPDPRPNTNDKTNDAAAKPGETTINPENAPYSGNFALPFGTAIGKDYSNGEMAKSLTMGDWRVHNGVDFAGEPDQQVVAIQSGTIKSVKLDPLWGVVLVVDHGSGIEAHYCGLSPDSTPKEGRAVEKGEAIGVIAQVPCESAESTHLHLEITVDGKISDPLAVMNKAS